MNDKIVKINTGIKQTVRTDEHTVEILSDSGEGAQTAGQMFAKIVAKSGNSVWTVEIIPAEIEPPARSPAGASGNRIRLGAFPITNAGDEAELVVGFNEQVLHGGIWEKRFKPGCRILLENKWATHADNSIVEAYISMVDKLKTEGFQIIEIPMEEECHKYVEDARRGKNMFVVGLLCNIYARDLQLARDEIRNKFKTKMNLWFNPTLNCWRPGLTGRRKTWISVLKFPPVISAGRRW